MTLGNEANARSETLRIVGLGGSLRPNSTSRAALEVALEGAGEAGAEIELLDLHVLKLPMYDPGSEDVPESVTRLVESTYVSDAMIWSSPLYHGSISGSFKNALDWLILLGKREPSYLADKVIGLISVAGGTQGLQAINTMEFIVRALRGWAVPLVVPIPQSWQAFDETSKPSDPQIEGSLKALGKEVARIAQRWSGKEIADPGAACAEAAKRLAGVAGK